jgi:hypothetical protein
MWFNKPKSSVSEAEKQFELDIRDAMTRARMAHVHESTIATVLTSHADGIRGAQIHARELRNNTLTPHSRRRRASIWRMEGASDDVHAWDDIRRNRRHIVRRLFDWSRPEGEAGEAICRWH